MKNRISARARFRICLSLVGLFVTIVDQADAGVSRGTCANLLERSVRVMDDTSLVLAAEAEIRDDMNIYRSSQAATVAAEQVQRYLRTCAPSEAGKARLRASSSHLSNLALDRSSGSYRLDPARTYLPLYIEMLLGDRGPITATLRDRPERVFIDNETPVTWSASRAPTDVANLDHRAILANAYAVCVAYPRRFGRIMADFGYADFLSGQARREVQALPNRAFSTCIATLVKG
ncbi:hypothetical protein [Caulobacter sp. DWR2-3-1b2]|uniref:hypothetical protein n=1 Tax=unclassified Caulobacter TaxID=2648921 RepID=UPI003CECD74F